MKFILVVIILVISLGGCKKEKHPNVKSLVKDVKIERLDRDVFALDTLNPNVKDLYQKYGRYFDVYAQGVLNLGSVKSPDFPELLGVFIKDPLMRELADSVAVAYGELEQQEEQLSWAWAYYSYYFPEKVIPQIYTHISGFNQSVIVDSAAIGIALDNYLGEKCVFYDLLANPIPMYARRKMTRDDIIRDALMGWCNIEFVFRPKKNDLLSGMIYQGKIVYLLEKLFPNAPENWLLGFSREQEKWCIDNEEQMWSFLIENEYLFSTQQQLILKYLNEAPFTSGMPKESPGKAVVWSGYQIVKAYVEKTGATLEALMQEQDYHKILRLAGYRP